MSKLLTVSVPSYKRPQHLKKCLLALAPQCMEASVLLNVYDDSCDDTNLDVYLELSKEFPCLTVKYNPKNLGIDNNIDQCISDPDTDYVWVIGEDDLVIDGAIDRIVTSLKSLRPICLVVNYQYTNDDYKTRNCIAITNLSDGYHPAGQFFSEYGWSTGFLGSIIVNRKYWDTDCKRFRGTYFNHVGKIFSEITPQDNILFISDPLVLNRAESLSSFTWVDDTFEVYDGFGRMTQLLSQGKPEWANQSRAAHGGFKRKFNFPNIKSVLYLRAVGIYNTKKYELYLNATRLAPVYAFIAIVPKNVLKFLYTLYKSYKKFSLLVMNLKK